jgi:hypothetical protein
MPVAIMTIMTTIASAPKFQTGIDPVDQRVAELALVLAGHQAISFVSRS